MKNLIVLKKKLAQLPIFNTPFFNKYRVFIVPFLVLITAIMIIILVTIPQFLKLFQTSRTINELAQKKQAYQNKVKELEGVNVGSYRQDLDIALAALPIEKDLPGVMGELLVAVNGSGLALQGINFSNSPAESDKVAEYTIALDLSGSETSLRSFLDRIKLLPRLIKLTSVDISKGTNQTLLATITLATFYQLLPTSMGSVDSEVPKISQDEVQVLSDIKAKIQAFPKVTQTTTQTVTGKLDPFVP